MQLSRRKPLKVVVIRKVTMMMSPFSTKSDEETGERSDLECSDGDLEYSDDDLECGDDDPDWASMEENTTESSEGDESEDDGQKTTRQDMRYMKHSDS